MEDQYIIREGDKLHQRCRFIHWNHLYVGDALLTCPVTATGVQEVEILLLGSYGVNHLEGGAVLFPCHPFMSTSNSSNRSDLCFQVWCDQHQLWEGLQRGWGSPTASKLADGLNKSDADAHPTFHCCLFFPGFSKQHSRSLVCRSTGSGSCSAEFQQVPLTITIALDSEVCGSLTTSCLSVLSL